MPPDWAQSPLRGQLRRLLGGVAVGLAVILAGNLVLMPLAGRSLTQRFEQHPAETAAASLSRRTAALSQVCPAPSFGLELGGRQHGPESELTQAERMIVAEGRQVESYAGYARCLMETDRERLCERRARDDLALVVKTYLGMRRDGLRSAERISRAVAAAPQAHAIEQGLRSRPAGPSGPSDQRDLRHISAVQSLLQVDAGVIAGLRALIEDGYLSRGDLAGFLGMFLPEELAPHLKDVKMQRRSCG